MNRRTFLASLAAVTAMPFVPTPAIGAPAYIRLPQVFEGIPENPLFDTVDVEALRLRYFEPAMTQLWNDIDHSLAEACRRG